MLDFYWLFLIILSLKFRASLFSKLSSFKGYLQVFWTPLLRLPCFWNNIARLVFFFFLKSTFSGLPWWLSSKESTCQRRRHGSIPDSGWSHVPQSTCQAPLSVGFSRQEYWSGLPFPFTGDLSDPGIKPRSPALQSDTLATELWGKPIFYIISS